jgi:uncharacterized protein (TIGR03084 family)
MSEDVLADLRAEEEALDAILERLPGADWDAPSAAPGWTIADVVLHLAQSEEAVAAATAGADWDAPGRSVDEAMAALVRDDRAAMPARGAGPLVLARWRAARLAALAALRSADPQKPLNWAAAALKPRTLATTRLAEHWAHALDVTDALGVPYPDTDRLRHIAWLGYSTLPYAFALIETQPQPVRCELAAPDGQSWSFGPLEAPSSIRGPAAAFCRVGAQRLDPDSSGLVTDGPYGAAALRVLRNYAA